MKRLKDLMQDDIVRAAVITAATWAVIVGAVVVPLWPIL